MSDEIKKITSLGDLAGYTGLVVFSAPWCGPCKRYKPELAAFAAETALQLREIDAGAEPALAGKFGVRAVPTTLMLVAGVERGRLQGAQTPSSIGRLLHVLA